MKIEPYLFINNSGDSIPAEIGIFQVPENRTKKDSRLLDLKFVRFKSTNPNPGYPIVYLAGGPGGSGIDAAKGSRSPLFEKMREVSDVIAFDQRGTGISDGPGNYLGWWSTDPAIPTNRIEVEEKIKKETLKAYQYFLDQGTDMSGYNTIESADDLEALRKVLGVEKLNLWGISYGTHLALSTLKRHKNSIHSAILAGVEPLDHTVKLPSDQQKLLEQIDYLLKGNPTTKDHFPDFLGDLDTLLINLEKEPAKMKTKNPMNSQDMDIVIGKFDMQMMVAFYLRGPDYFKDLPLYIKQALNGNYSGFYDMALYTHLGRFRGMSMAMDIASGISPERLKRIHFETKESLLGDAINFPYLAQREALSHLDLGDDFRKAFTSDIPILCISGTLDGRTPPENAEEVLSGFANGSHLIIEGAGHSDPLFLSSPRILEVMIAFLEGKELEDERIVLPPVKFTLPE